KTAKVSVKALTVHSRSSSEAPMSVRITGIAVETTRLSSTTMNNAIEVTTKVQRVRLSAVISVGPFLFQEGIASPTDTPSRLSLRVAERCSIVRDRDPEPITTGRLPDALPAGADGERRRRAGRAGGAADRR